MKHITIKFNIHQVKNVTELLFYNHATDFKDVVFFTFLENTYLLNEEYCKQPDCPCTRAFVGLAEVQHGTSISTKFISFSYDYESKTITNTSVDFSPEFAAAIVTNDDFNAILKQRQKRIKSAFNQVMLDNLYALSTQKTGRNHPCPCGSGNKYKKCCGG